MKPLGSLREWGGYRWGRPCRQCKRSSSGCPHTLKQHIKPHHLELFVLQIWSENVLGTVGVCNCTSCQFSSSRLVLLLPIQTANRKYVCFNLKLLFKPLNGVRSAQLTARFCVKFPFSYSNLTDRKHEDGFSRHRNWGTPAVVQWKLCNVGTGLGRRVWGTCLGASLQKIAESRNKCDSIHFWSFGENRSSEATCCLGH